MNTLHTGRFINIDCAHATFHEHAHEDVHEHAGIMHQFCACEELHAHVRVKRCTSTNTLYKSASRLDLGFSLESDFPNFKGPFAS